jgi:hypothetical protein
MPTPMANIAATAMMMILALIVFVFYKCAVFVFNVRIVNLVNSIKRNVLQKTISQSPASAGTPFCV